MIGAVFVYLSGSETSHDQRYSDRFVNDSPCKDVAAFLVEAPCSGSWNQNSTDFAEPRLRRLALPEGVLVDLASFAGVSHEALLSARAACCAKALSKLKEINPATGSGNVLDVKDLQRRWMEDSLKPLISEAKHWQDALKKRKSAIDHHARILLTKALAAGWQPLRGKAPEGWELDQEDEELHDAVSTAANNLLEDHRTLTLASLYDAAAFMFSAEADSAVLKEVAQAMSDLAQIATELKVPLKRDLEQVIEAVRTRTLARAIAPGWRRSSCIGSPDKHGVVVLTDTDADTARLVLRGVANAQLNLDAATQPIARREFANDEFEDLEVPPPKTGLKGGYQHYGGDSETVREALESTHELDGSGFIAISLNASKHRVIINSVTRFDMVSFTREEAKVAAMADQRFATYFSQRTFS